MAHGKLRLAVVTPERALLEEDSESVVVPAWDGEVGILPGHARFLAKLGMGELRMVVDGRRESLFIDGGFVQVSGDRVTVLTDRACHLQDIDVRGAEAAVDKLRRQTGQVAGAGAGEPGWHGEEYAEAVHRWLTMKRIKNGFNAS